MSCIIVLEQSKDKMRVHGPPTFVTSASAATTPSADILLHERNNFNAVVTVSYYSIIDVKLLTYCIIVVTGGTASSNYGTYCICTYCYRSILLQLHAVMKIRIWL